MNLIDTSYEFRLLAGVLNDRQELVKEMKTVPLVLQLMWREWDDLCQRAKRLTIPSILVALMISP